jgi:hypothetical protein
VIQDLGSQCVSRVRAWLGRKTLGQTTKPCRKLLRSWLIRLRCEVVRSPLDAGIIGSELILRIGWSRLWRSD